MPLYFWLYFLEVAAAKEILVTFSPKAIRTASLISSPYSNTVAHPLPFFVFQSPPNQKKDINEEIIRNIRENEEVIKENNRLSKLNRKTRLHKHNNIDNVQTILDHTINRPCPNHDSTLLFYDKNKTKPLFAMQNYDL